jgi:hypothetical protein
MAEMTQIMSRYAVLNHLLHDVFRSEGTAETRSNAKALDDHILELAEAIRARPVKPVEEVKEPLLVRFGDDVRITLWHGKQGKIFSRPLKGFYIYKTNEPSEMAVENITAKPGKDGYTWFMKNYGLNEEGKVAVSSKVLEPHEGPVLCKLLAEVKSDERNK